MSKFFALALLLAVAGPSCAAVDTSAAVAGFAAFRTDLLLIAGGLLGVSLLVFPVRFVARLFRG